MPLDEEWTTTEDVAGAASGMDAVATARHNGGAASECEEGATSSSDALSYSISISSDAAAASEGEDGAPDGASDGASLGLPPAKRAYNKQNWTEVGSYASPAEFEQQCDQETYTRYLTQHRNKGTVVTYRCRYSRKL